MFALSFGCWFSTRNAHMVHVVNLIRFKNGVYILVEVSIWILRIYVALAIFQPYRDLEAGDFSLSTNNEKVVPCVPYIRKWNASKIKNLRFV